MRESMQTQSHVLMELLQERRQAGVIPPSVEQSGQPSHQTAERVEIPTVARPPERERDYEVIDKWIAHMEKILWYMQCSEELKVLYATYMLKGHAEKWWQAESDRLPNQGEACPAHDVLSMFSVDRQEEGAQPRAEAP
ncbi:hypothetical protein ACLOJK_006809, partial [Asimina triloba]